MPSTRSVTDTLIRLGGVASWRELRQVHGARAMRRATKSGDIVRLVRGRYVTGIVHEHRRRAVVVAATTSHLDAAIHHGWKVKNPPTQPWLTVPRNRKVATTTQAEAAVFWSDLSVADLAPAKSAAAPVTGRLRTVVDCARALPFDEALAVADSALRSGRVTPAQLRASTAALRGNGSARARRVATYADARAANPFESVLRSIAIDTGLDVTPQVEIITQGVFAVVDLADTRRRIVLEAESFEFHSDKSAFVRDLRRYAELVALNWRVLRFTWVDVMFHPVWVSWAIDSLIRSDAGLPALDPPQRVDRRAA